jgi:beta-lactamase class A
LNQSTLTERISTVAATVDRGALAVSAFDYLSGLSWHFDGDRWFHAASTMKVAVLAALFDAVAEERFALESRLHVRNRFISAADGEPFRVEASRDADAEVYASIGRTMRLIDLATHMIVRSSNLATNLLLDLIGLDAARRTLARRRIEGVDLQRGVEDERAFARGLNNRVTANGIVRLFRAIHDAEGFTGDASRRMLDVLYAQQFTGGIGPGLPEPIRAVARIAHKTGDISSVSHDVGVVSLPGRPPYVLAVLAEGGDQASRSGAIVAASRAVYDEVSAAGEASWR